MVTGVSHAEGIGAAICKRLAMDGCAIFFTYWDTEPDWAKFFRKELEELGIRAASSEIDLSNKHAAYQLLDEVEEKLGLPTILVNNAAYSTRDGYEQLDVKTLDSHYQVNMRSTFLLCVEFAKRLKKAQLSGGRIVNMTSGQAQGPMLGELAYGATKAAISGFTLTLSAEIAPLGITVNAVNPGPTDTGWMTDEIKQALSSKFLMGRMGLPDDAARLVTFLAGEDAGWITGQVINSEGGFLRS